VQYVLLCFDHSTLCLSVITMYLYATLLFKIIFPLIFFVVLCSLFHIVFHFIPQHGIKVNGLNLHLLYPKLVESNLLCD
jgi:hypothetical protein